MPQNHKVTQGECLSSIAKKYGFNDYRIIYDDGANAAFKQKRPNPNIIFPGDIIVIPDHELKEVPKPTEQTHNFVIEPHPVKLRLVVKNDEDKPFANMKYDLKVGSATFSGTTDGGGKIEQVIQPDDSSAELVLYPGEGENKNIVGIFKMDLGHLDPRRGPRTSPLVPAEWHPEVPPSHRVSRQCALPGARATRPPRCPVPGSSAPGW